MSLVALMAVTMIAGNASAAFFAVNDLGGNLWEVGLQGEPGDPAGNLGDSDLQSLVVTGATFVSVSGNGSAYTGKTFGPTFSLVNATTANFGGSDLFGTTPFNSATFLKLGEFTLSGAPTTIELGGAGLYTSNLSGGTPIPVNQSSGAVLFQAPEPASLLLIGLGLSALAFARRKA